MTEPKFHVGQKVGVCTSCLSVVIPATTVLSVVRRMAGRNRNPHTSEKSDLPDRWVYRVNGCEHTFCEWTLRPIDDDEYKSTQDTDELEKTK